MKRVFYMLAIVLGLFLNGLPLEAQPVNPDRIRVGIASSGLTQYVHQAVLLAGKRGSLTVVGQPGAFTGTLRITRQGNHWTVQNIVNKQVTEVTATQLSCMAQGQGIRVPSLKRPGGIPYYRGGIDLIPATGNHGFYVVNTLSMQDYLKAVVPNELPARFGLEAVKAQSVAARNYALRPRETFWKAFDICDSQYCQAYYGAQTETPATNQAVEDTAGLVLLHQHQLALTVFSSTAAGVTEAYAHVFSDPVTKQFPAPPLPYLVPQPDSLTAGVLTPGWDLSSEAAARAFWTQQDVPSFDSASPYYRWTRQWSGPQLQQDVLNGLMKVSRDGATRAFVTPLLKSVTQFGLLTDVRITARGKSGKAMQLQVTSSRGQWLVNKEFLIRAVLNQRGKLLPSGNVVLTLQRAANGGLAGLTAEGGGLGHGVGMSQYGASGMDRAGYTFDRILAHYYPGAVLATRPIVATHQSAAMTFRVPSSIPPNVALWVNGDVDRLLLNQQQVQLQARQPGKPQCYPLPGSQLHVINQLEVTTNQQARVWIELASCS